MHSKIQNVGIPLPSMWWKPWIRRRNESQSYAQLNSFLSFLCRHRIKLNTFQLTPLLNSMNSIFLLTHQPPKQAKQRIKTFFWIHVRYWIGLFRIGWATIRWWNEIRRNEFGVLITFEIIELLGWSFLLCRYKSL